jgi:hypothetical protein
MNSTSVAANGLSDWLPLIEGKNKIVVTCPDWAGSYFSLRTSHDGSDISETVLRQTGSQF